MRYSRLVASRPCHCRFEETRLGVREQANDRRGERLNDLRSHASLAHHGK